jgi:hypothetical protein
MEMSLWRSAIVLGLLAMSGNAHAGGLIQGTVNQLIQRASDGLVYVVINGTATGTRPACATGIYWMVANENSEAGKRQFAMLLAAYANRSIVQLKGMGTCTRWPDGEDINELLLLD